MIRPAKKLQAIFLALSLLMVHQATAQSGFSQSIYFSFQDLSLPVVLDSIGRQAGISFSYNADILDSGKFSASFRSVQLIDAIRFLFDSTRYGFLEKGRQIVIFPRENKSFQESPPLQAFVEMNGWVKDQKNEKAIAFASISLPGKPIGTITNTDGYFSLKIPYGTGDSLLMLSCIGYKGNVIPFRYNANSLGVVYLQQARISIPEAVIRPTHPIHLINAAREAIPVNYDSKPVYFTAFFREISWKDKECISLSESVVKIYKGAYHKEFDNDQIRLLKGRKKQDMEQFSNLDYKVEGGLFNSLLLDIVKSQPSFLLPEYFKFYDYSFEGVTQVNGLDVYKIHFDQKPEVMDALFKGSLYIDVESLAIIGAVFSLSPHGMKYARSLLVRKSPRKYQIRPVGASYMVSYRKVDGKWNLNDVHTELNIRAKGKRLFFNSLYQTVSDLVITGKDTLAVRRFKNSEVARSTDIISNQISDFDPGFWEDFMVLQPETRIEEAVNRIQEKLETQVPFTIPQ